jgi:hypothetical protein
MSCTSSLRWKAVMIVTVMTRMSLRVPEISYNCSSSKSSAKHFVFESLLGLRLTAGKYYTATEI